MLNADAIIYTVSLCEFLLHYISVETCLPLLVVYICDRRRGRSWNNRGTAISPAVL